MPVVAADVEHNVAREVEEDDPSSCGALDRGGLSGLVEAGDVEAFGSRLGLLPRVALEEHVEGCEEVHEEA